MNSMYYPNPHTELEFALLVQKCGGKVLTLEKVKKVLGTLKAKLKGVKAEDVKPPAVALPGGDLPISTKGIQVIGARTEGGLVHRLLESIYTVCMWIGTGVAGQCWLVREKASGRY